MNNDIALFLKSICQKIEESCNQWILAHPQTPLKEKAPQSTGITEFNQVGARLIPVVEWNKYHTSPKVATLRGWIFQDWLTGSDYFVRRQGRKVLIDEKSFFEWMNMTLEQRVKSSPKASEFQQKYGKKT